MKTFHSYEATKAVDYKFLKLDSEAFLQNEMIPEKYTCDGINVNPPIHISGIPKEAKSLVIITDDPDAPGGSFCHWVIWNIPVTHVIKEKEPRGVNGLNDFNKHQYNGPCPPTGIHRYNFKIYALDCSLDIPVSSNKVNLEKAMAEHVLGFGILQGKYARHL